MSAVEVFARQLVQGTVTTRSLARPQPARRAAATLRLAPADLADPGLAVGLEVQSYGKSGPSWGWAVVARLDWVGGPSKAAPTLAADVADARVRVSFELSRPASAGADLLLS